MERSDKHGARIDEEMEREIKGLVQGAPVDPPVEGHRRQEDTEDMNATGDQDR